MSRRDPRQTRRVSTSAPFIPPQVPGNVLWLRADLGVVANTSWADQSGSGNNYAGLFGVAATGNARGTGPALTFNGTTQFLTHASAVVGNANLTVFVVHKTTSAATQQASVSFGSDAAVAHGWAMGPDLDGAGNRTVQPVAVANMTDAAATTNWENWTITRDSTTWALTVNGTSQSLTANTTAPGAQAGVSAIGCWTTNTPAALFTGSIDEVIAYSRKLSATEQAQVEAYIRSRTGIW